MQAGIGVLGRTGLGESFFLTRKVISETTLRQASVPFVTATTDSPASTFVDGRLSGEIEVRRELPRNAEGRWYGFVSQIAGRIELESRDGDLDAWLDLYEHRDRPIRIKAAQTTRGADGREHPPALAAFSTQFAGRVVNLQVEGKRLSVTVEDGVKRLDRPIQQRNYLGHGGINGGPELAGQPKPLTYGLCSNTAPTLVDSLRLIYQVHDGEVKKINAVYDRGVALTPTRDYATYALLEALSSDSGDDNALLAGTYATCLNVGYFRLGGLPFGRVTADVEGDGANDGPVPFDGGVLFDGGVGWTPVGTQTFSRYAGGMLHRILLTRAIYTAAEVDIARLAQFDEANPYPLGLHVPTSAKLTVREAISSLADSVGAVVVRTRQGQFSLVALEGPAPGGAIAIDAASLADDGIESVPLPYGAAWPTVRVRYGVNWTPMTEEEISADVTPARRDFLTRPTRYVDRNDATITALLPDRPPLTIEAMLVERDHALAVAARLQRHYATRRRCWRVRARGIAYRLDLLDTVTVTAARHGLAAGRQLLVVGIAERPGDYETELLIFG